MFSAYIPALDTSLGFPEVREGGGTPPEYGVWRLSGGTSWRRLGCRGELEPRYHSRINTTIFPQGQELFYNFWWQLMQREMLTIQKLSTARGWPLTCSPRLACWPIVLGLWTITNFSRTWLTGNEYLSLSKSKDSQRKKFSIHTCLKCPGDGMDTYEDE